MNKLILKEVIHKKWGFYIVGILETQCFPASFYAGPIRQDWHTLEWIPKYNDTRYFHCTKELAFDALVKEWVK